jgi:predicted dehydrogenase
MMTHPTTRVLLKTGTGGSPLDALAAYLRRIPHMDVVVHPVLEPGLAGSTAAVTCGATLPPEEEAALAEFVRAGNGWLHVADAHPQVLPAIFGAAVEPLRPETELRVLFEAHDHPLGVRLPEAVYVGGCGVALSPLAPDTQTLLYADWHFDHRPVLTLRREGRGRAACTTLTDLADPVVRRILYRLLRDLGGAPPASGEIAVAILGYAPSVGKIHGVAVENTAGLRLKSVCDLDPRRVEQARIDFPGIGFHASARSLAQDPSVDLVLVATPPNTHTGLCLELLAAGKHVVCEKPLALSRSETDRLVETAERAQRHLGCHQNRRWDPDYLAVKQAVDEGRIGELFYAETFVGGFGHPCGYWHSHAPVSGGTAYDWGAHYLDWIVGLMPHRVEAVVGTRHKRVWHDVTNADQERIQIRFEGGREAEFLHSDIAAARKPKWYLLGTRGAITAAWRDRAALAADPLLYYSETPVPATEMPPALTLHRRESEGRIEAHAMVLPPRDPFGFHRNLADHLLAGEPLAAPLADSVKVVAILESAARSMQRGGTVEVLDG